MFFLFFKKYLIVRQENGSYVITAFYPILVFISQKCLSALGSGFGNHNSFSFPESSALSRNVKMVFSCSNDSLSLSSALHECMLRARAASVLSAGAGIWSWEAKE